MPNLFVILLSFLYIAWKHFPTDGPKYFPSSLNAQDYLNNKHNIEKSPNVSGGRVHMSNTTPPPPSLPFFALYVAYYCCLTKIVV